MALDHYYKAAQETTEGLRIIDDSLWRLVITIIFRLMMARI